MSPAGQDGLPEVVIGALSFHLARQRWYAGQGEPAAGDVEVMDHDVIYDGGGARLWWVLVSIAGGGAGGPGDGGSDATGTEPGSAGQAAGHEVAAYQLLVGERAGGEPADFLVGHDAALVASDEAHYYYDATSDSELALALLEVASDGAERAERVRPVGAEQSNTSLVYDDRLILKVYRRVADGPNPDVAMATALARTGFDHVPAPLVTWRRDGRDLAFGQQFLSGGSEGWALALTSLADFYAALSADPGQTGGDFAGEAARLGSMTAQMHLAMADAFGVDGRALADGQWLLLVESIAGRLAAAAASIGGGVEVAVGPFVDNLRRVREPGPAMRVHGDYHLGQVMRTDTGWYVLDFEGEPIRPVEERLRPTSPLKDVSGMVRSFQYASRFALSDRAPAELDELRARAEAWEWHNRVAFVDGYRSTRGVHNLLPADEATWETVLAAFEMDKALYELDYERAYRPDWLVIPTAAIVRLLEGR